jgi:hypothetical protein
MPGGAHRNKLPGTHQKARGLGEKGAQFHHKGRAIPYAFAPFRIALDNPTGRTQNGTRGRRRRPLGSFRQSEEGPR